MTARKPNVTTRVRGRNRYGKRNPADAAMLRQSGARSRGLQNGIFNVFNSWRAARDNSHDDTAPGLDDVPSNSGRNEFVESTRNARQKRIDGK